MMRSPADALLAPLLPAQVRAEECFGTDPVDAVLFPEEEARIAPAVEKRRREFTTVRHCARLAMARLGIPPAPLLPGERGAPAWPDGVVGSMTHCAGYRAAAVALADEVRTVGIDAEPALPLPEGVLRITSSAEERARLAEHAVRFPDIAWDRLLFSAKEAVYKAWFPVTRRWLGFEEADVEFAPEAGTFRARLLVVDRPFDVLDGRWATSDGIAVCAITVLRAA